MDEQLRKCQAELERLEVENDYLRDAAAEFGDLAERLNVALEEERRRHREYPGDHNTSYRPLSPPRPQTAHDTDTLLRSD